MPSKFNIEDYVSWYGKAAILLEEIVPTKWRILVSPDFLDDAYVTEVFESELTKIE